MASTRMEEAIRDTDIFLKNHKPGEIFHVFLSTSEKEYLREYLKGHDIGKKFRIVPGVFKPGHIEHDYYLEERR